MYKIGKSYFDVDEVVKLGKREFCKRHKHIKDAAKCYDLLKNAWYCVPVLEGDHKSESFKDFVNSKAEQECDED